MTALLLISGLNLGQAQDFSGKITKKLRYEITDSRLDEDSLRQKETGDVSTYLIKDGYYKSAYLRDDKETYSYTYRKGDFRMYDYEAGQPYITWRDARISNVSNSKSEIFRDSIRTILGYECFMVKTAYEDYTNYSFHTDALKVATKNFKGHEVGNWYDELVELDGAQTLMSITVYEGYKEIWEATEVDVREVKNTEFDLPKGLKTYPSSQALDAGVEMKQPSISLRRCYLNKVKKVYEQNGSLEEFRVILKMIINEKGDIEYVKATEADELGFAEAAVDIVQTCGFEFEPGKLKRKKVASVFYFPIDFFF